MSYTADPLPAEFKKKLAFLLRLTRREQGMYEALLATKKHEKMRPRWRHLKHIADRRESLLHTVHVCSWWEKMRNGWAYKAGMRVGKRMSRGKEERVRAWVKEVLEVANREFQLAADGVAGRQELHAYHALLLKCAQDVALTQ